MQCTVDSQRSKVKATLVPAFVELVGEWEQR